jgi:hypothetical protein
VRYCRSSAAIAADDAVDLAPSVTVSRCEPGTVEACVGWPGMRMHHAKTEPRHDHAPDTDDVWAWIVIGLIAAGTMLAIWLPMLKVMLQA